VKITVICLYQHSSVPRPKACTAKKSATPITQQAVGTGGGIGIGQAVVQVIEVVKCL